MSSIDAKRWSIHILLTPRAATVFCPTQRPLPSSGLLSRFLGPEAADPSTTPARNSKLYHLKRFFYDTAASANPIQMRALKSLVGSGQIVFGSDFPFIPVSIGVRALEASGFTAEELRAIFSANPVRLLPNNT